MNMVKAANKSVMQNRIWRYERKFFISEHSRYEIEKNIKLHPAFFSEIYHQRYVNNIYFDSVNMEDYVSNVSGLASRKKVRIRWYGDLFGKIEKPVLEFKIKRGLVGTKQSYPLDSFVLNKDFNMKDIVEVINKAEVEQRVKVELKALKPFLLNRYSRKYFQSVDKNFRLTIDSDLHFYKIDSYHNLFFHNFVDKTNNVLELKYNEEMDHRADTITNFLPYRMTRSSKYVSGVQVIYG
ncbi:polyphosphate polymerase domain-containing protein [bacterium]|nr:polyphosphate polymerase domain-containing protein [bacterium]